MYVYKITNAINGKVYIGQTINPVQDRFRRHINDAMHNVINTHFARAIRKYGEENFSWEIIDTASNEEELNQKEVEWILFYDACHKGYNTSPGGYACGGNTYFGIDNLDEVRIKLSESKKGRLNPNSRCVKMIDTLTNTTRKFESMQEAADYLGLDSHMPVSRRCRGYTKNPLYGRYQFEYCSKEGVTTIESIASSMKLEASRVIAKCNS